MAEMRRLLRSAGTRFVAQDRLEGALRQGLNCGVRGRDFPPSRRTAKAATPVAKRRAQRGRAGHDACGGRQTGAYRSGIPVEGAHSKMLKRSIAILVTGVTAFCLGGVAYAGLGQPTPWELGLQQSATPVMDDIVWFHDLLLWLIAAIALFVLVLLAVVVVRFNARANPVPSRTTHNTTIEILWTVVPVLILVTIAVPSFRLLFYQLKVPAADITVKATGKQWFWSYSYPDSKFEFDSLMVQDKDLKTGQPRLLAVDNDLVVPVNKVVHLIVTGADVIHSFSVPSFGVKIDAIPGRVNETWFKAEKEGVYYGQCSQLCGRDHAFMPIAVLVVSEQAYSAWLEQAKKKYADDIGAPAPAVATEQPVEPTTVAVAAGVK
jgi:cytochrome c oxidase subunit 2